MRSWVGTCKKPKEKEDSFEKILDVFFIHCFDTRKHDYLPMCDQNISTERLLFISREESTHKSVRFMSEHNSSGIGP